MTDAIWALINAVEWELDPLLGADTPGRAAVVAGVAALPEETEPGGYRILAMCRPDLPDHVMAKLTEALRAQLYELYTAGAGVGVWKPFPFPGHPGGIAYGYDHAMTDTDPDYDIVVRAIVVEPDDALSLIPDPDKIGLLIVQAPTEEFPRIGSFVCLHRVGLGDDDIAAFREFCELRVYSFLKNGPLPDLWQERTTDTGYETWFTRSDQAVDIPDTIPTDWA